MSDMDRKPDPYDYPKYWEADVLLSDGGTVHLRPITPDDARLILGLHGRLSDRTRYFRYFGAYPRMSERDLKRFSVVDHHGRVAFGAFLGHDLIAVGRYEQLDGGDSAEVAFVVEDGHQGRGIGSIMLEHLAAAAAERGLRRFVAEVLTENGQMVRVFREAGYRVSRELEAGVLHLEFAIDPTERSVAVQRAREQAAEARSVHNLLHPASVAVIGASTDPSKLGYAVLTNLLAADFAGPVYPVNSEHRSVRGVRAYVSVLDIPDQVDLAVVAVPAAGVDEVLDACLAKGVRTLVVLSAGFADIGPAGMDAERKLVAEARAHGMRVVGPNALGVLNNDPAVRLNATLAPRLPGPGHTGFFCQSGALGIGILADAAARGLGLSTFVSAGNRADVSGNDLLQYWATDPATRVVLLYLESFGNPRKFARLARRLARHKPIVAVKSGRHGVRPSLAANSVDLEEASVQALFEQAGVIRVESLAQLFDTALLLANQPLPVGDRVAVVGNSTAIGLLAADTIAAEGLQLAFDPVDTGAQASPEQFAAAVRDTVRRDDVDAVVVVFIPPLVVPGAAYALALREVVSELASADGGQPKADKPKGGESKGGRPTGDESTGESTGDEPTADRSTADRSTADRPTVGEPVTGEPAAGGSADDKSGAGKVVAAKPIVSTFLAVAGVPDELAVPGPTGWPGYGSIPSYSSPERAVLALARVARYASWRSRPRGEFRRPEGIDLAVAREIVAAIVSDVEGSPPASGAAGGRGSRTLSDVETLRLLACYRIGVVDFHVVDTESAAVAAAEELGFPVAVKSTSKRLRHSVDLIGVRLDLGDAEAVRTAFHALHAASGQPEVIVQRMVPRGTSCVIGLQDDPSFGSLVSFGLSGIVSDLLGDRAYRAVPLTDTDAAGLVRAPRAAPLLAGYGGGEPVDQDALAELVLRVNAMAEDLPEVRMLVLDPVLAAPSGAAVSSAVIVLGPPPSHSDAGPRRLRSIGEP
ncbi:MAG TPA: GNAT family N-acetyltransferase [Pseudonocardiaceae bacterium]|nr:GNAT family N-acetyltransferase [Pseudonocardiaceae bacterium]